MLGKRSNITYKTAAPDDTSMLHEARKLQAAVWGTDAQSSFPEMAAIMRNGGCLIIAYDEGVAVGFSYSFPGYKADKAYLCSHMLGILPDYRDNGIGLRLKLEQRNWALAYGYGKIVWTYDPLESRNGYLNLCKLGGYAASYVESYYGEGQGVPMDRLIVEWDVQSARVGNALADWNSGHPPTTATIYPKIVDSEPAGRLVSPLCVEPAGLPDRPGYLLAVPKSIQAMKQERPELVLEWRLALRETLCALLSAGYIVTGLQRAAGEVNYYVVEQRQFTNPTLSL